MVDVALKVFSVSDIYDVTLSALLLVITSRQVESVFFYLITVGLQLQLAFIKGRPILQEVTV